MERTTKHIADKKVATAFVIILVVSIGSFVIVYLTLRSEIASLQNDNANLLSEVEQLRQPAVRIYNQTKFSVVSIMTDKGGIGGSGFICDPQGHIVTNSHVVQGATNITVTFFDRSAETAQIVGTPDVYSDLAMIKADRLPAQSEPLPIRNSTQLAVGEPVYAIGNPFGLSNSITSGIISQLGRVKSFSDLGEPVPPPLGNYSIPDLIQFDAPVNTGNSGGPLLDGSGSVIGVTFAIETGNTGVNGFIGIGYAIPSVLILRVVPALESAGHYDHPWVGIEYDSRYTDGVKVISIVSGGPANKAGLQVGDVIKEVDGVQMNGGADFVTYLERYRSPGDTMSLEIDRNGTIVNKALILETRELSHPGP